MTPTEAVEKVKAFLVEPVVAEGVDVEDVATRAKDRFWKIFRKQLLEKKKRAGEETLSPSTLGKCTRQLAYSFHGFKGEPLDYKSIFTFIFGDIIELFMYVLLELSGVQIDNKQRHVEVKGPDGLVIQGDPDGSIGGTVVDIKSMSDAAFSIAERSGVSNDFGYLSQLELYKRGLGLEDGGGAFVAANKNRGTIAAFVVENRPLLVSISLEKMRIVKVSTRDNLPARDYVLELDKKSGQQKLAMQCKFCAYNALCWNITGKGEGYNHSEVIYASGPKEEISAVVNGSGGARSAESV